MKHQIYTIIIIQLFLFGCRSSGSLVPTNPEIVSSPVPNQTPFVGSGEVIKLECDATCLDSEHKALTQIQAKLNDTLRSECFKAYFISPQRRFKNALGLSGIQIVEKLQRAANLKLSYYYNRWTKAVGYESADDFNVVHINRAKVGAWSTCELASLVAHERSHALGFFHDGNSPANNQDSIPYEINHSFEDAGCCK